MDLMTARLLAAIPLVLGLLAAGCSSHEDRPRPTATAGSTSPAPPVTAQLSNGVQANWTPPATCEEVAQMRALLAGSTQTDPLTELMRSGTEEVALRLGCP